MYSDSEMLIKYSDLFYSYSILQSHWAKKCTMGKRRTLGYQLDVMYTVFSFIL